MRGLFDPQVEKRCPKGSQAPCAASGENELPAQEGGEQKPEKGPSTSSSLGQMESGRPLLPLAGPGGQEREGLSWHRRAALKLHPLASSRAALRCPFAFLPFAPYLPANPSAPSVATAGQRHGDRLFRLRPWNGLALSSSKTVPGRTGIWV